MGHQNEYHDNMITMVELLGQADADHFVEDWRAMVIVVENGEMQQGYFRGRRPD